MIRLKTLILEDKEQDDFMKRVVKQVYDRYVTVIKKHDPKAIVSGFPERLSPASAYADFFNHFKDKRTGYDSLTAMIRGEFDAVRDKALLDQLSQLMTISGITNQRVANGHIKIIRLDSSTADAVSSNVPDGTKEKYNALLPKVREWWLKWLNDPITIQKAVANINANKKPNEPSIDAKWLTTKVYPIYNKVLYSIEFRYYNPNTQKQDSKFKNVKFSKYVAKANAFVQPSVPATVFINVTSDNPNPLNTLIHEVQHLLWHKYPLNPTKQILNIFNNKSNDTITSDRTYNAELAQVATKYNIGTDTLKWWKERQEQKEKNDPGYNSDPNEKMSNIQAVRNHFKLKPGQNITVEMLRPHINNGGASNTNVYWLLMGWAAAKFPDLQKFVNDINALAVNDTPNNQNIT
jgi:hypothetical protein